MREKKKNGAEETRSRGAESTIKRNALALNDPLNPSHFDSMALNEKPLLTKQTNVSSNVLSALAGVFSDQEH